METPNKKEKFTFILNANNSNYIVPIDKNVRDILYFMDYNIYLQQIEKVYSIPTGLWDFKCLSKKLIWKEFTKDIHRCDLKINNISYKDPDEVRRYLNSKYPEDIVYRTLMFSTPDSLGLPYEILHKVFADSNSNEKMFVVEPNVSKRYYKIDIKTTENSIGFLFDKNLRLIDEEGNSKFYVYVKIEFDILNDDQVFINFSIKKVKPKE